MVQRGRNQEVPEHEHPDYVTQVAHDAILHQQGVLPSDARTYYDLDLDTTDGAVWTDQFVPPSLDIPSWVSEINITCVAVCDIPNPTSTGDFGVRIVIGGSSNETLSTHTTGDPSQCVCAFGDQITDPGDTLAIKVQTNTASSGDDLEIRLTTSIVFERFAGNAGGPGLAG